MPVLTMLEYTFTSSAHGTLTVFCTIPKIQKNSYNNDWVYSMTNGIKLESITERNQEYLWIYGN